MSVVELTLLDPVRAELNARRQASPCADLFAVLDEVRDPELPALTLWELGVLQNVERADNGVVVTITPTYSGCPALEQMRSDICDALAAHGVPKVTISLQLAPAWSSDWLAPSARVALLGFGIAPPGAICCPQCGSDQAELISEPSGTACQSLWRCSACAEPFTQFRKH